MDLPCPWQSTASSSANPIARRDNEVREVSGMDKGDVVYRPVITAPGPGVAWAPAKRLPLANSPPKSKARFSLTPSDRRDNN